MTIHITGDTHGTISIRRFTTRNWPTGKTLTKNDYVIILGDFGLVFDSPEESPEEKYWLDWLDSRPWTTLFIDGNHENFDRLFSDEFEVRPWHGGQARFVRPSVIHLIRGEIYDIDGISFLAFGGAHSIDKHTRVPHESWWEQEVPNFTERGNCIINLENAGNQVDVVLTHDAPSAALRRWPLVSYGFSEDTNTNWLQTNIAEAITFNRWFFGHFHIDAPTARPYTPLFDEIIELELDGENAYSAASSAAVFEELMF